MSILKTIIGTGTVVSLTLLSTIASAESIFRFASEKTEAANLDPIDTKYSFWLSQPLYSRLVRLNKEGKAEGDLAESWSSSGEFSIWTLNLRNGVKFHDGSAFDAEDVVDLFKRIKDPKLESPLAATLAIVKSVAKSDDHKVIFTLASPHADFPLLLADFRLKMVPSGSGATIGKTGIGTGPFKLVSVDAEGTTVYQRFDGYWEGPAKVDRIEIITIPDAQARVQAMQAGQIDWLASVNTQQASLFANNPDFQVIPFPSGDWKAISVDTRVKPYNDPKVRKALRMVVDRKAMSDLVLGPNGGTISCDDPVGPTDQYRVKIDCPADVNGAKALLAEAGYPDGIDVELSTSEIDPHWVQMAEVYQQQAAPAGIRVKIKMTPADAYWSDVWMKHPAFLSWWGSRPADQILNEAFRSSASWNEAHYSNPDFDAKLDRARQTPTFEERRSLYADLQKDLYETGGTLIPFHLNTIRVLRKGVSGLGSTSDVLLRWNEIAKE
jgi:peptide/nickel transport system substrate-binding protein